MFTNNEDGENGLNGNEPMAKPVSSPAQAGKKVSFAKDVTEYGYANLPKGNTPVSEGRPVKSCLRASASSKNPDPDPKELYEQITINQKDDRPVSAPVFPEFPDSHEYLERFMPLDSSHRSHSSDTMRSSSSELSSMDRRDTQSTHGRSSTPYPNFGSNSSLLPESQSESPSIMIATKNQDLDEIDDIDYPPRIETLGSGDNSLSKPSSFATCSQNLFGSSPIEQTTAVDQPSGPREPVEGRQERNYQQSLIKIDIPETPPLIGAPIEVKTPDRVDTSSPENDAHHEPQITKSPLKDHGSSKLKLPTYYSPFLIAVFSNPYAKAFAITGIVLFIAGVIALGVAIGSPQAIAFLFGTALTAFSVKVLGGFAIGFSVAIGTGLMFFDTPKPTSLSRKKVINMGNQQLSSIDFTNEPF